MAKFTCSVCDKDCSTKASLSNHMKYKHPVPGLDTVLVKKKRGRPRKVVLEEVPAPSVVSFAMQVEADLVCRYCPGCGIDVDRFRSAIPGQFRYCPECGFGVSI